MMRDGLSVEPSVEERRSQDGCRDSEILERP
jgi:hypothetical protein